MAAHSALIPLAKDHLARGGLQDRGHRDVDGLANHLARVIDDHHGAVIEIGNALVVLFSFLQDEHPHNFARQNDGLERVGQFVDVEHGHTLQLRDFIEVEVVGDDLAFIQLGQFDELHIDFADAGEVIFHDLDLDRSRFLETLQDVEAAAAAIAFERVGGIGHQLQFAEHELRDHNKNVEETGLGDVGDAAVNNDAGIEDLVTLFTRPFAAEDSAERRQIEQIAFVGADRQSHVSHDQHDHDLQETLDRAGRATVANDERAKVSAHDTEHAADRGSDQALQTHCAQPPLKHDDGDADQQTDGGIKPGGQIKRMNESADDSDDEDKQKAYKDD